MAYPDFERLILSGDSILSSTICMILHVKLPYTGYYSRTEQIQFQILTVRRASSFPNGTSMLHVYWPAAPRRRVVVEKMSR